MLNFSFKPLFDSKFSTWAKLNIYFKCEAFSSPKIMRDTAMAAITLLVAAGI